MHYRCSAMLGAVEDVGIDTVPAQYPYSDGDGYVSMNEARGSESTRGIHHLREPHRSRVRPQHRVGTPGT